MGNGRMSTPTLDSRFSYGCADYEVWVQNRGGRGVLGRLTGWDTISYQVGTLNGVSQATVTIPNISGADADCCGIIAAMRNWQHELSIRRGSDGEVWLGPILQRQVSGGKLTVTAYDLGKWQERRFIHDDYNLKNVEALTMFSTIWHDAIDADNSMGAVLTLGKRTGVQVSFQYKSNRLGMQTADQTLRQTGIAAVDWYTWLRETHASAPIRTLASRAPLVDDWVIGDYDTDSDGSTQVNDLIMQGTNRGGNALAGRQQAGSFFRKRDGLLQAVESDQTVQTQPACQRIAADLIEIYSDSPNTVSSLVLSPRAPYRIGELMPGYLLEVALARLCQPVFGSYRIQQLAIALDAGQNSGMEIPTLSLQYDGPSGTALPVVGGAP
jgi:hypothetical protein